jgi:hypothetical protein
MELERETATYWAKLPELAETSERKFVVIHGDEIAGIVDTYRDALALGYDRFEPGEFMVKQILRAEPILYFTRDLG